MNSSRILVFYEDYEMRTMFRNVCQCYEYVARSVGSFELLEGYLETLGADIVLLDEELLDDVCRRYGDDYPDLCLLVATPSFDPRHHEKLRQRGADELIVMPSSITEIKHNIEKLNQQGSNQGSHDQGTQKKKSSKERS